MCYQYLNWFKYTVMKNISHADALGFLHYWEELFANVLCGAVGKFILWQGCFSIISFLPCCDIDI